MFEAFLKAPVWVWGILAYLIFVGMRARQTRAVSVYQLCIVPAIFLLMRSAIFFAGNMDQILIYGVFLALGCVVGFAWAQRTLIRIFKHDKCVEIPGSSKTLVMFLVFFAIKYVFGALQALNPVVAA